MSNLKFFQMFCARVSRSGTMLAVLLAVPAAPLSLRALGLEFFQQQLLNRLDEETGGRVAPGKKSAKLIRRMPSADLIEILPEMSEPARLFVTDTVIHRSEPAELDAELREELKKRDLPLTDFFSLAYLVMERPAAIDNLVFFARSENPAIAGAAINTLVRPAPARAVTLLEKAFSRFRDAPEPALLAALNAGLADGDPAFGGLWLKLFTSRHEDLDWCRALTGAATRNRLHPAMGAIYDAYFSLNSDSANDFPFTWTLGNALGEAFSVKLTSLSTIAEQNSVFRHIGGNDDFSREISASVKLHTEALEAAENMVRLMEKSKSNKPPANAPEALRTAWLIENGIVPPEVLEELHRPRKKPNPLSRNRLLRILDHGLVDDPVQWMEKLKKEKDPGVRYAMAASLDATLGAMSAVKRGQVSEKLLNGFDEFCRASGKNEPALAVIIPIWRSAALRTEQSERSALFASLHVGAPAGVRVGAFGRTLDIIRRCDPGKDKKILGVYEALLSLFLLENNEQAALAMNRMLADYLRRPLVRVPNCKAVIAAVVQSLSSAGEKQKYLPERIRIIEDCMAGNWFGKLESYKGGVLPPDYKSRVLNMQDWWKKNRDKPLDEWPQLHRGRSSGGKGSDALKMFRTLCALDYIDPSKARKDLSKIRPENFSRFISKLEKRDLERALSVSLEMYGNNNDFTTSLLDQVLSGDFKDKKTLVEFLDSFRNPGAALLLQAFGLVPGMEANENEQLLMSAARKEPALVAYTAFMQNAQSSVPREPEPQMRALQVHLEVSDPLVHEAVARALDRDWKKETPEEYGRGLLFCEIVRRGKIMIAVPQLVKIALMKPVPKEKGESIPHPVNMLRLAAAKTLYEIVPDSRLRKAVGFGDGKTPPKGRNQIDAAALKEWWDSFSIKRDGKVVGTTWPWPVIDKFSKKDLSAPDYFLAASFLGDLADRARMSSLSATRYRRWWLGNDPRLRWRGLRGLLESGGGRREFGGDPRAVLENHLTDPDPWIRMTAMYGLYRIGDVETMTSLVRFIARVPDHPWAAPAAGILAYWAFERGHTPLPASGGTWTKESLVLQAQFSLFRRRFREIFFNAIKTARKEGSRENLLHAWMTMPVFDMPSELDAIRWILYDQPSEKLRARFFMLLAHAVRGQENNLTPDFFEVLEPYFGKRTDTVLQRKAFILAELFLVQMLGKRTLRDELTIRICDAAVGCLVMPPEDGSIALAAAFQEFSKHKFLPEDKNLTGAQVLETFRSIRGWWDYRKKNSSEIKAWKSRPAPTMKSSKKPFSGKSVIPR